MTSAHTAHGEPSQGTDGDMRRLRRRGRIATGIGSAGYIITFIADIVRDTPHDDSIVNGVERAFGFIAIAGFLTALAVWALAEYNRASERRHADELSSMLRLGFDAADAYPRRSSVPTPRANIR
jgi:hypothetical protein